jgi:KilA-N domain
VNNSIEQYQFKLKTIRHDGMVNATALTTAYRNTTGVRKDVRNWLLTPDAKASIAYLERVTGVPVTDLVIAQHGVGTWLHPDLAEILAQWISEWLVTQEAKDSIACLSSYSKILPHDLVKVVRLASHGA